MQGTEGPAAEGAGGFAVRGAGGHEGDGAGGPAAKDAGGLVAEGANRSAAESAAHRAHADADEPGTPGDQDTEGAAPENAVPDPAPPEARPGDAARAALRGAVAARRTPSADTDVDSGRLEAGIPSAASADSPCAETHQVAEPAPPAPAAHDAAPARPEARPADAAREALREARKRRAAADASEAALAGRPRRTTPAASRDASPAPRPAAGARARDVRELLADAFRMPDDVDLPGEDPEDDDGMRQGSSVPRPPAADDNSSSNGNRTGTAPSGPPGDAPTDTGGDQNWLLPAPAPAPTPASPHHPHSMAAPNRDNDLRRTFPAFPPRTSEDARFAATWWGNAWVSALEEGALDAKRLARGRSYAEQGHVDAITVTPGLVLAYVQGSRPRPYRVQVRLRTLGDADWDRFLDLAADRTGHIAALLDKEMPQALAECGVPLLPGPGDLEPQCSCPDRGHPCKHAAALCYQTARLLDADPFVLFLLRGRSERELLDALSRLSAARAARAAQEQEPAPLPGVRASEALAPRRLPPLPAPLPAPAHPEQPPAYPASPGGPDPFALDQLATDAAARAHALLGTGRDPVGELTLWQDAVRLAAARPGSGLTAGTRALYASSPQPPTAPRPIWPARSPPGDRAGSKDSPSSKNPGTHRPAASTAPAPSSSPPTSPPSAPGTTTSPIPAGTSNSASAATACGTPTSPNRATTTGGPAAPRPRPGRRPHGPGHTDRPLTTDARTTGPRADSSPHGRTVPPDRIRNGRPSTLPARRAHGRTVPPGHTRHSPRLACPAASTRPRA